MDNTTKGSSRIRTHIARNMKSNNTSVPLISGFGNAGSIFGQEDEDCIHPQLLKIARKSGQLNLSNKGLAKVPQKVFHINELDEEETDQLAQNVKMDSSDEDKWWERTDLSRLYLNSNVLTSLDPLISKLCSLQLLDLSDNRLKVLPSTVGDLKSLSKLNLSHNDLTTLPQSIGLLDELRSLTVDHNNLTELPEEIETLHLLENLDVSHNQLVSIPSGLCYLQRLAKLVASDNKIEELPLEIGDLFGLVHLDISRNGISSLPPSLGNLPKLRELCLRQNKLEQFPSLKCSSLKEMYLGVNRIKVITDEDLESLSGLHVLDLGENGIDELPNGITLLQELQRLDLANNYLSNVPAHIGLLPHLKSLTLEGNPLRLIRRDIVQRGTAQLLKYLASRALEPISSYPGFSDHPSSVCSEEDTSIPDQYEMRNTRVMVYNQKAKVIPDKLFENGIFANVRTADLSQNMLIEVPEKISEMCGHLSELVLNHNRLSTLPSFLGELKYLQFLDVQNNLLTDLPSELSNLQSLREINMAFNKFQSLPECIFRLPALEILFAGDNKITEIPVKEMSGLHRLATLDLHNNDISFVPPELGKMTQLRTVLLQGNGLRVPRAAILAKGTEALLEYLRSRIVDGTT